MSDTVAAPAETGNSKWLDWIEKVGNKVVPVLERVADGEPIDISEYLTPDNSL